jgi:hypothetical protein
MKKTLFIMAVLFAFTAILAAQASEPKRHSAKTGITSQLTGCLSEPNGEGGYVLTNGRHKKGVEVSGRNELKKHVGHKVKLMGTWVDSGAEIGEKEDAAVEKKRKDGKQEAAEKHFKVAKVSMVADSCTVAGASR